MTNHWIVLAIGFLWVATLGGFAGNIYRKRRNGAFFTEHALFIGGLLLLALAPCVLLVVALMGDIPAFENIAIHLLFAGLLFAAAYESRRRRLQPGLDGSPRTFSEKSAMVVVLGQVLVFGSYFYLNWSAGLEEMIPAFVSALVLLVIIMIIGHIVIALFHYPIEEVDEPVDERARQIQALAERNGNWVILAGFWTVPLLALGPVPTPLVVNSWLAFLVVSAIVKYGSIVLYGRLGFN